jgi:hypothetical protein
MGHSRYTWLHLGMSCKQVKLQLQEYTGSLVLTAAAVLDASAYFMGSTHTRSRASSSLHSSRSSDT